MAAPANVDFVSVSAETSMKIKKLKCKAGQKISKGTVVCLYLTDDTTIQRLKSNHGGVIKEIAVKEGEDLKPGALLYKVEVCSHPTVMKDMCADCGSDLRLENASAGNRKEQVSASVAMVHSIPELIVSEELAREIGKADEDRLLKTRKLVLLVDLDQTLIHTTNDNIPANLKDVHHFQLWHGNQLLWYHTRLRPFTQNFLESISKLYELHICTFGARMYAHTIAKILDPEGKFFSHRILSRDECFNASTKTANLKALFPCGESMVCIIDDREDVWTFAPNLIHVKPYRFFQGTADINAPTGLTKTEHDSEPVIHRVRRVSQSSTNSTDGKDADDNNENTKFPTEDEMKIAEKKRLKSVTETEIEMEEDVTAPTLDQEKEAKVKSDTSILGGGDGNTEGVPADTSAGNQNEETIEAGNTDNGSENKEQTDSMKASDEEKENVPTKDKTAEMKDETQNSGKSDEKDKKETEKESNESKKEKEKVSNESKKETEKVSNESKKETEKVSNESKKEAEKVSIKSKKETEKVKIEGKKNYETEESKEELIVWEDDDDYLFYLKEILENIHSTFYDMIDQLKGKDEQPKDTDKPNLKNIMSYMKKKVLKGCNIIFSGVIPTNMAQEKSRAFIVAKALGANIHKDLVTKENEKDPKKFTTHLVAARQGTLKVRSALKCKSVFIVSADWLWSCAERWEKVEEDLFPLTTASDDRNCDSPDVSEMMKKKDGKRKLQTDDSSDRSEKRAKTEPGKESGKEGEKVFSQSYNCLYAFSDDDLAYMDKEVEDEMGSEEGGSSEEEEDRDKRLRCKVLKHESEIDSSSQDSLEGNKPRGWGLKRKLSPKSKSSSSEDESPGAKKSDSPDDELGSEYASETDQDKFEKIMDAFESGSDNSDNEYKESIGSVDDELADAVEKEFLS